MISLISSMIEISKIIKLFIKQSNLFEINEDLSYKISLVSASLDELSLEDSFSTSRQSEHVFKLIEIIKNELQLCTDLFADICSNVNYFVFLLFFFSQ